MTKLNTGYGENFLVFKTKPYCILFWRKFYAEQVLLKDYILEIITAASNKLFIAVLTFAFGRRPFSATCYIIYYIFSFIIISFLSASTLLSKPTMLQIGLGLVELRRDVIEHLDDFSLCSTYQETSLAVKNCSS